MAKEDFAGSPFSSYNQHARPSRTSKSFTYPVIILALLALVGLIQAVRVLYGDFTVHITFNSKPNAPKPHPRLPLKDIPKHLQQIQDCSISALHATTNLTFLDGADPLTLDEFVTRRDRLAAALHADGLDAFIAEPGYIFQYYANISQPDWEVWEPEERPFLMVVQPSLVNNRIRASTSFLVPAFEAERARLLDMPFPSPINLVTYEEHWNPYLTLLHSRIFPTTSSSPTIMIDEETRDFISRGLATNGFAVRGLSGAVERVRQQKSSAEIALLRAVNTGTVEALRATRTCLIPDLTELDVQLVLDNTMRSAGLDPFFDIVLFDANAANPHGGTNSSARLAPETMVLIDVGAHLHGYSSDICRSFFPPFLPRPSPSSPPPASLDHKIEIWSVVLAAQTAAIHTLHANATCAAVDLAARNVIAAAGYGEAFTHRVGHGIGIKAHESPYLHKGNTETLLKKGMTFTAEPGVYLEGKFGVRHEDVLLVGEEGEWPEVLSGKRAEGPWDP